MRKRQNQRGNAMLETAFIFTVLATMLMGVFDFGQFLFVHQALVERTRSAVRWGVVNGADNATGITNMVLYNQSASGGGSAGYFGLTTGNIQVSHTGAGTDDNLLTVKIVNFPYQMFTPFLAGNYTGPEIRVSASLGMFN